VTIALHTVRPVNHQACAQPVCVIPPTPVVPPTFIPPTPVVLLPSTPVVQQVVHNPAPMMTTGGQSVYGTLYNGGMGNCRQTSSNQQIVSDLYCACLSVGQSGDCSNTFGRRRLLSSATQQVRVASRSSYLPQPAHPKRPSAR
jgi:hypothetical protein